VGDVLREHRPEIIFHAAAHKHVPLMEENPCEAVKNNVRGTRLMARAAESNGVDRFIMISTDKAVNPTSVMGASKQLAELLVQAQADGSRTSFSIVRFGNVLGSNGSVVPRFMDQIRRGGPVTITHPEMRRFFMLIPEAVQLVLHAASHAESGAIYVLEMGKQVKLVDMARDMIRLSGFVPDADIKIEFVGLRPGEKLFEELVGSDEEVEPSSVDSVLCVRRRRHPPASFSARIEALEAAAAQGRSHVVLAAMKELTGLGADRAEAEPLDVAALQAANVLLHRPNKPVRKVPRTDAPRRGRAG
jgi:FlaA1/EpsC-like NDP-sugar epimerase